MIKCIILFVAIVHIGNCKKDDDDSRIVGGSPISITEVPFMALYRPVGDTFHCGAAIISDQFLVSAAHCLTPRPMQVTVGTDKIHDGQHYQIEKNVVHPEYGKTGIQHDYDIIVIKLMKKLTFSSSVAPIELAGPDTVVEEGQILLVTGFGETMSVNTEVCKNQTQRLPSDRLLGAIVPHRSIDFCRRIYGTHVISDRMICAGGGTGKDSCQGDSGGPLIMQGPRSKLLVGIVSFGISCATEYPGVYARVSALKSFIDNVISGNIQ